MFFERFVLAFLMAWPPLGGRLVLSKDTSPLLRVCLWSAPAFGRSLWSEPCDFLGGGGLLMLCVTQRGHPFKLSPPPVTPHPPCQLMPLGACSSPGITLALAGFEGG